MTDAYKLTTREEEQECRGLSTLTQLESLILHTIQSSYPSLEPVYALVSLRSLTLAGGASIHVTTELSCLTNLTHLTVRGEWRNVARLTMQWSHMPALQTLRIACVIFVTADMTVLMNSKDLKAVEFASSQPADMPSSQHFARLIHLLGSQRPEVKFICS